MKLISCKRALQCFSEKSTGLELQVSFFLEDGILDGRLNSGDSLLIPFLLGKGTTIFLSPWRMVFGKDNLHDRVFVLAEFIYKRLHACLVL